MSYMYFFFIDQFLPSYPWMVYIDAKTASGYIVKDLYYFRF